jgi:hypothetical protein
MTSMNSGMNGPDWAIIAIYLLAWENWREPLHVGRELDLAVIVWPLSLLWQCSSAFT